MTAAAILLGYAVLATVAGGRALARARWPVHSPGWGVVAWQSLTASVAGALLLAGVAVALPFLPEPVAQALDTSSAVVVEHYQTPVGAWPGIVTLGASVTMVGWILWLTSSSVVRAERLRRTMRRGLDTLGRRHPDGYTVLEHPTPLVYSVPGRSHTVVVTRGALAVLTATELRLVLGHERRHLRARHDLALAFSGALATAFRLPLVDAMFAESHRQIAVLIEMSADDAARDSEERRVLAGALVALSSGSRTVSDELDPDDAAARVRRLTTMTSPLGVVRGAMVGLAAALAVVVPVGLSVAPAIEAAATGCCASTID